MATYNLGRLSSLDFEELLRDLLSAEWGHQLEAFSSGRDGGIDLRHISADGGNTIIQCKHYLASNFAALRSSVRAEREKVEKIGPTRYLLATSQGLTPGRKDKLVSDLAPIPISTSDILGSSDIEALIRSHPEVEKVHYKLWLTSTAVLERVLHSAELCQTDFQIEKINRKLPVFVQNSAFPRALEILKKKKIVVIAGPPGIGKSTLAEMLIYAHLEEGYEPIVIQSDVKEGQKLFRSDKKQVFYFDDFLGQTYLGDRPEFLGKNQDSSLSNFLEMIQHSKNARFILTTREHILGGALEKSEKLANSSIERSKCVIELSDYGRDQKARILFNHLYFSELPKAYKDIIISGDFFLEIIDHKNFNPRIVEWLSSYSRIQGVEPDQYAEHIEQLLDEPERIWRHAFENQISDAARNLLLVLYSSREVEVQDVEQDWTSLHMHCSKKYNFSTSPKDFKAALKELDGSFIHIEENVPRFINPSVRDFLAAVLAESRDRVHDILAASTRFRHIESLWNLGSQQKYASVKGHLVYDPQLLFDAVKRLFLSDTYRWDMSSAQWRGIRVDSDRERRVLIACQIAEHKKGSDSKAFLSEILQIFTERLLKLHIYLPYAVDIYDGLRKLSWVGANSDRAFERALRQRMLDDLPESGPGDWLRILEADKTSSIFTEEQRSELNDKLNAFVSNGARTQLVRCESLSDLESFRDYMTRLQDSFGLNFKGLIEDAEGRIADQSSDEPEGEGSALSRPVKAPKSARITDAEVKSMFGALLEP